MIKTLRESKAKLSELVDAASRGEDVLITVHGKVKARLTRASGSEGRLDRSRWVRELRAVQKAYGTGRRKASVERILDQVREERI